MHLVGDESGEVEPAGDRHRLLHELRPEVGAGHVTDLARRCELHERLEGLLDGGLRIGMVLVVEVDVVGAQPTQADVAALEDALPQNAGPVRLPFGPIGELGGHHHRLPPAPRALPRNTSDCPPPYISAVSKWVMPASRAACTTATV